MTHPFKDKFSRYLDSKLNPQSKNKIFGDQFNNNFNSPSLVSDSKSLSNAFSSTQKEKISTHSINSSQFNESSFQKSNSTTSKARSHQKGCSNVKPKRLKKLKQVEENVCAICLDQIKQRCNLPCKHAFCFSCVEEWFKSSNKCPYCRAEVNVFWFKGEEYEVQSRDYEYEAEEEEEIDWICYNCDETKQGDIIMICDRCEAHACHIQCDEALHGFEPEGNWYCHFCRLE